MARPIQGEHVHQPALNAVRIRIHLLHSVVTKRLPVKFLTISLSRS